MTPQRLDDVGQEWSRFLLALPQSQYEDRILHIEGTQSIYEMRFDIVHVDFKHSFYYVGVTARPTKRPSEHISEFMRASARLQHGKSIMYDPLYMHNAIALAFYFKVIESGFGTSKAAENREAELALEYARVVPQGFMLSNQNRGRGEDTRPRFKRAKKI